MANLLDRISRPQYETPSGAFNLLSLFQLPNALFSKKVGQDIDQEKAAQDNLRQAALVGSGDKLAQARNLAALRQSHPDIDSQDYLDRKAGRAGVEASTSLTGSQELGVAANTAGTKASTQNILDLAGDRREDRERTNQGRLAFSGDPGVNPRGLSPEAFDMFNKATLANQEVAQGQAVTDDMLTSQRAGVPVSQAGQFGATQGAQKEANTENKRRFDLNQASEQQQFNDKNALDALTQFVQWDRELNSPAAQAMMQQLRSKGSAIAQFNPVPDAASEARKLEAAGLAAARIPQRPTKPTTPPATTTSGTTSPVATSQRKAPAVEQVQSPNTPNGISFGQNRSMPTMDANALKMWPFLKQLSKDDAQFYADLFANYPTPPDVKTNTPLPEVREIIKQIQQRKNNTKANGLVLPSPALIKPQY